MYIYCEVCYRLIVAPYVKSVGHVFAYLYTLDYDSECPMGYETSLPPKVFCALVDNPGYVPLHHHISYVLLHHYMQPSWVHY